MPLPEKPGYIDECPDCLFEKTVPFKPTGLARLNKDAMVKLDKAIASIRDLAKHGVPQDTIERTIAKVLEIVHNPPATR